MSAKILYLDIETSPIVAHVWGLWQQNVGINQIIEHPEVIGVGYSWDGKPAKYISKWDQEGVGGRAFMLGFVWQLLDDADVVTHWNGQSFDTPWLNTEFAKEGLTPPSPYKQLDLMRIVKKHMRFPSNKLDYVSQMLLGDRKLSTGGHQLWIDCLNGDPKARAKMARYCRKDVDLLPKLLKELRPYIGNQINFALYAGIEGMACQKCGSANFLRPKGVARTAVGVFPQHLCCPERGGCGGWTREPRSIGTTKGRGVAL